MVALGAVPGAGAQGAPADSARPEVTVPLPNGSGVFYYRAGTPGGVHIRSRTGPPPAPESGPEVAAGPIVLPGPPASERAPSDGVTRLDLLVLERDLLDAIDRRLAALDLGRRSGGNVYGLPPPRPAPVIVVPGQAASPAVPAAPPLAAPSVEPSPAPPLPEPSSTVEEIERAILDTGLFRTTRVNFEFGKAALIPVSEAVLGALADVLQRYPDLRIEIGGHTDSVSSEAFNLRLSKRRAEAVRDFLIGSGLDAGRLVATGYGEGSPVASNETETGRALNRRVEFVVLNPEAAERARRTVRDAPAEDDGADLRQILREELERLRREQDGD